MSQSDQWTPIEGIPVNGDIVGGYDEDGVWWMWQLCQDDCRVWDMWKPPVTHFLPARMLPALPAKQGGA